MLYIYSQYFMRKQLYRVIIMYNNVRQIYNYYRSGFHQMRSLFCLVENILLLLNANN